KDLKIPVYRLDVDIGRALSMANDFTKRAGLAPKSGATSNVENASSGRKEQWVELYAGGHLSSTPVDLADLLGRAAELRASGLGQPDYGQLYVRGAEVWWVGGDGDEDGFGDL